MEIVRCTFDDLLAFPGFTRVRDAYSAESAQEGFPVPELHLESYRAAEAVGMQAVFAATVEGKLAGYAIVMWATLPHYSVPVANIESLFVLAEHRKAGAGLRLLAAAERCAEEAGAVGLFLSAAVGKNLDRIVGKMKRYKHTHNSYLRLFK